MSKASINIIGPQSQEDASHHYFIDLLALALEASNADIEFNIIPDHKVTYGRTFKLLGNKYIDVFWAGTSIKRENQYQAIRIPLFKGLLGYRVAIIKQQSLTKFNQLNLVQLKQQVACQGEHWPDTEILRSNQFQVMPVARFELMFKMVNAGHCDYFPRALFEGYGELELAKKTAPDLTIFDETILHYPFAVYYFVRKEDNSLAQSIQQGLIKLKQSGEFDAYMQQHQLTKHLFPLSKWQDRQIFRLTNPLLPKDTDLKDESLWVNF